MKICSATYDLNNYHLAQERLSRERGLVLAMMRFEVQQMANELLDGKKVYIEFFGRPYKLDDVFTNVSEHPDFAKACIASRRDNPAPMKKLINDCACYVVAEHLFDDAAGLGFSL